MCISEKQTNDVDDCKVAIVGGSYAGLSLANVLHLNSISCTIFDRRTLPFTHVMGGNGFNVPSLQMIQDRLELRKPINDGKSQMLTRKGVIDSLSERVIDKSLLPAHCVVRIIKDVTSFYIVTELTTNNGENKAFQQRHGPFDIVVGADGVLSTCRITAHTGVFLVGDARWVNDRWFDLGLRRIDRGADIAMGDGSQLGEAILRARQFSKSIQETIFFVNSSTKNKFCSKAINRKKTMRLLAFVISIFAILIKQVCI